MGTAGFMSRPFAHYLFIYLALPTKGRVTTTAYANYCGPFNLTHPANVPCGRKPEYSEETGVLGGNEDWVRVALRKFSLRLEPAT
jgi:hypothetical protein